MTEEWLLISRETVEQLRHTLTSADTGLCGDKDRHRIAHDINQAKVLLQESLKHQAGAKPDKWQYAMETIDMKEYQLKGLNTLGAEGWEIVAIVYHPKGIPEKMILKRKVV